MKKILLFTYLILSSFFLEAQTFVNYNTLNAKNAGQLVSAYIANDNSDMTSSCYLFKNWENNATILFNNNEYLIKNMNYDALNGKFVSQISKDSVFIFYNLDKVFIVGKTFIKINNRYYQSLDSSNPKNGFLKEYYIKEIKPEVHVISNKVLKSGEIKLMQKYYFNLDNNLIEVKLRKKDVLEVFKLHKEEISNYVKNNKLSYQNEEDVLNIYRFYESHLIN